MKKWSFIVAALYGLILWVLMGPLLWISLGSTDLDLSAIRSTLLSWQLWVIIGLMTVAQFALLRFPVRIASRRPVTRSPLLVTAIAAAFMMGLLLFGAGACVYEFFAAADKSGYFELVPVGVGTISWIGWSFYFYRVTKSATDGKAVSQLQGFLWKGSILELLVAVPTHIVARHRDQCCAGFMTFVGLTCGMAVMVFAFGPSVYFLFTERWRRLHPVPEAA